MGLSRDCRSSDDPDSSSSFSSCSWCRPGSRRVRPASCSRFPVRPSNPPDIYCSGGGKGVLPIIYIHYIGRRLVLCPAPVTCARASVGIGPWLFIMEKNFFLAVPVGLVVEDAVVCCRGCRPQPMAYSYWRMRAAPRLLKVASAPSKVGSVEINRFLS